MKKIIKLKESDLSLIVGKVINESLGVPEGILEASEDLYEKLISELNNTSLDTNDNEHEIEFLFNFTIGDLEIETGKLLLMLTRNGMTRQKKGMK